MKSAKSLRACVIFVKSAFFKYNSLNCLLYIFMRICAPTYNKGRLSLLPVRYVRDIQKGMISFISLRSSFTAPENKRFRFFSSLFNFTASAYIYLIYIHTQALISKGETAHEHSNLVSRKFALLAPQTGDERCSGVDKSETPIDTRRERVLILCKHTRVSFPVPPPPRKLRCRGAT